MFPGIGDCCRGTDENRVRAVMTAEPLQAAEDPGDLRTKDPPVDMDLIDDHKAQAGKEIPPRRMFRENPLVEHVRVGEDNPPFIP